MEILIGFLIIVVAISLFFYYAVVIGLLAQGDHFYAKRYFIKSLLIPYYMWYRTLADRLKELN